METVRFNKYGEVFGEAYEMYRKPQAINEYKKDFGEAYELYRNQLWARVLRRCSRRGIAGPRPARMWMSTRTVGRLGS